MPPKGSSTDHTIRILRHKGKHARPLRGIVENFGQDGSFDAPPPGPTVPVTIKRGPSREVQDRSAMPARRYASGEVALPVALGEVFERTTMTKVRVEDVQIKGRQAIVIAYVETVSNSAGKLRLTYEQVTGEWILRNLENLNFGPR